MEKEKKGGGTYIAPAGQIRREREVFDRNGNLIERKVQEPVVKKKEEDNKK